MSFFLKFFVLEILVHQRKSIIELIEGLNVTPFEGTEEELQQRIDSVSICQNH